MLAGDALRKRVIDGIFRVIVKGTVDIPVQDRECRSFGFGQNCKSKQADRMYTFGERIRELRR